ncbi:CYTH domain-containing protein [Bacteroidia bacterium]|nr:CYTH domain-containing protein [Bacteroidia bacterium]GHU70012.1 CYTH domain-containing protein [Bacteroidia bacterium]
MSIEIERKFLVKGDFLPFSTKKERIIQAYLSVDPERTVRIRTKGEKAYITIKGASNANGFSHVEFEYPVPLEDAEKMLELAVSGKIDKERHYIPVGNHIFEVDVFHGNHEGLIIAELELSAENEPFNRPDWLGEEVTGIEKYYNAYLAIHSFNNI